MTDVSSGWSSKVAVLSVLGPFVIASHVGCGIPGWVYLPVDATDVRVSCRFWHVDDWGPRLDLDPVPSPMQEWHQGQGAVEIQGWWPGDYDAGWAA